MNKDLPKVYANNIDKTLNNNDTYSYSKEDRKEEAKTTKIIDNGILERNVHQKIDDIFNSSKYVYKADVLIKTNSGTNTYKIIGKNYNNLITIDNELIKIDEILDIGFVDE